MYDRKMLMDTLTAGVERRAERRRFLKVAGTGVVAAGGLSLVSACGTNTSSNPASPTPSPTATTASGDVDILNFALNLEYLEANYYSFAAFGQSINATLQTGTGTQGAVTGGRQVQFADPTVASYAREIAQDELTHVMFLRNQLGASAVAQPAINIDGSATGAFTAAARAATVVSSTGVFDPYASDDAFLLGAFLFEDVGVTAYKGAASLITNATYVDAAAGILAVEAYHAGLIRTLLYRRGVATPSDRTNSELISTARDSLDGTSDDDQGVVTPSTVTANGMTFASANLVPTDANSIVYGRSAANTLNVVYLNHAATSSGGFFPSGVNGNIKTSGAN